jgi:hypothetical protein
MTWPVLNIGLLASDLDCWIPGSVTGGKTPPDIALLQKDLALRFFVEKKFAPKIRCLNGKIFWGKVLGCSKKLTSF